MVYYSLLVKNRLVGDYMNKSLNMFLSFFKIGAFTLGGGYAMIPLIEKEIVDRKKWMERQEFLDMLALAQSSPGPIAVNTSVFVGYKVSGFMGVVAAVLGAVLPAYLAIILVATVFINIKDNAVVERIFKGIRPAVVALVAVPVVNLSKGIKLNFKTALIPIIVALLVVFIKLTPIVIIIVAALLGILYKKHFKGGEAK